jgi:putative transport protein
MGGATGAHSLSDTCREAAMEIDSSMPWIGFFDVLLSVFGYFAMLLAR